MPAETPAAVEAQKPVETPKEVVKTDETPISTPPAEGTQKDETGATATSNEHAP